MLNFEDLQCFETDALAQITSQSFIYFGVQ